MRCLAGFLLLLVLLTSTLPLRAGLYEAAKAGDLANVRALLQSTPGARDVPVSRGMTPLDAAVAHGHLEVVKALLDAGASVAARPNCTPSLHLAVWNGNLEIATLLLDHGAAVDQPAGLNMTPLHLAAWKGSLPLVTLLLARGANVHAVDMLSWTPLHYTAWAGHSELVDFFTQKGVDINAQSKDGWTALHLAVAEGKTDTVKALLARKAAYDRPTQAGETPLMCALGQRAMSFMEWRAHLYLLSLGLDQDEFTERKLPPFDFTAVRPPRTGIAAARQEIATLLFTLQRNETPDFAARTPGLLTAAAGAGQTEIMTYLLANGVDPNAGANTNTGTPLLAAARNGQAAALDLLLKAKVELKVNERGTGKNALHLAAEAGQVGAVVRLLDAGMPIDEPGSVYKRSALGWALEAKQIPAAMALIERHAQVNVPKGGVFGDDAIAVLALKTGDTALMDQLLAAGLDLTPRDRFGNTLLHTAVTLGNVEIVRWLLAHGAEVNAEKQGGLPPLFCAASPEIADALVAKGATLYNADHSRSLAHCVDTVPMLAWCAAHGLNLDEPMADGVTPLIKTAGLAYLHRPASDTTDMMTLLLKQGANPNARAKSGLTALLNATQHGLLEAVTLLLDHQADANLADNHGVTPLMCSWVADRGLEKAKLLLAHGANPNAQDDRGETLLYLATQGEKYDLVALMLEQHANQSLAVTGGETPLLAALRLRKMGLVDQLLAAKPELKDAKDADGRTPVSYAVEWANLDQLGKVLALGANPNGLFKDMHNMHTTPLHVAAAMWDGTIIPAKAQSSGSSVPWISMDAPHPVSSATPPDPAKAMGKQFVSLLLEHGSDVNGLDDYQETPLFGAARFHNLASATLLIEHGADLQAKSKRVDYSTPLGAAVAGNCVELVKLMVRKGMTCDNMLFFCAKNEEMMDYLFSLQLSPNVKDAGGSTPLHHAIWANSATTIEQLITHGADAKAVDKYGHTPLQYMQSMLQDGSLIQDYQRKMLLLTLAEGNYTLTDAHGWTLLHVAAVEDQHYVIDQLLAHGLDINVTNADGYTPLFAAVNARNPDAVAYLLDKKGCNVNVRINTGQTPLHAAVAEVRPPQKGPRMPPDPFQAQRNSPEAITTLVNLLLAHGADPHIADQDGKLPIDRFNAAKVDCWPAIIALAKAGKSYAYRGGNGMTLLHLAVALGDAETTQVLLTAKVDLNAVESTGRTPLHLAVICRQYALAHQLIEAGAHVTLADNTGMTALHYLVDLRQHPGQLPKAAVWGLSEPETLTAIDALLAHGADINARNQAGQTPLGLYATTNVPAIREKLLAKGGKE